jgi:hypothetical protein
MGLFYLNLTFKNLATKVETVIPTESQACLAAVRSYDIFINCNWVVTRWQYTFTHKHYIEQHK